MFKIGKLNNCHRFLLNNFSKQNREKNRGQKKSKRIFEKVRENKNFREKSGGSKFAFFIYFSKNIFGKV